MTEAEWLTGTDMLGMLDQANRRVSKRKLRLFGCACCRRFLHLRLTDTTRRALEASEGAADARTKFAEMAAAKRAVPVLHPGDNAAEWASNCAHFVATRVTRNAALLAYSTSVEAARSLGLPSDSREPYYAALLRDICGNPFRPARFDPSWMTPAVRVLAEEIYEDRALPEGTLDPGRLAILGDALEDAGCDNQDLLAHCRDPGAHVRGCWPVDLILGKE